MIFTSVTSIPSPTTWHNYEISPAFSYSLQLMFDQTLSYFTVRLLLRINVNTRNSMLQWILGRFDISQNLFETKLAKNRIYEVPLT